MPKEPRELLNYYKEKRDEIQERLLEFRQMMNESNERIFAELSFCLCTPQSKATAAWTAITSLVKNNLLYNGSVEKIKPFLNVVRFGQNKANYIVEARKKFMIDNRIQIKEFIQSFIDPVELREWFAENVKGFGMKESSHFIRNIGLSDNQLAILDVHILKKLKEYEVIENIPATLSKKEYLKIENKMKEFSKQIGISMNELDILFWSKETGFVFK
jgi:N-glycosylase/DNA lyase